MKKIHLKIEFASNDENMRESTLRWFDHIQRRVTNSLVRKIVEEDQK